MEQYLSHAKFILTDEFSAYKPNRTGIGSISRFGYRNEYDLSKGFPLITTKKMPLKSIIHELIWFLRGESNIKYLVDNNVNMWNGNAFDYYLKRNNLKAQYPQYSQAWNEAYTEYERRIKEDAEFAQKEGDLGPVYGRQWRHWKTSEGKEIDQLEDLVTLLHKSPQSRRMIVTAWNPEEIPNMALPPCHALYQFNAVGGRLDCQLYQRSCDMFLGVPFNIASYAMLTIIVAQQTDLQPGVFSHVFGDAHFYCGSPERSEFYGQYLPELKKRVRQTPQREGFLEIRQWIEETAAPERAENLLADHVPLILTQLSREPKALPTMKIAPKRFDSLTIDDFVLSNYDSHPAIKGFMAV